VQTDYKTKKEREPPDIRLSLLHVRFRTQSSNLLHTRLRKLNLRSQFSISDSFRDTRVHTYDFLKFVGVRVGVANIFFGQSIGINENNTFQFKFLF